MQGRWHPRAPLQRGLGALGKVVRTIEGAIGHERGHAIGHVPLVNMGADKRTKVVGITAIAAERLHEDGDPGLVLDDQISHHLVQVGPMIPAVTPGDVHDLRIGLLVAVVAPIDMETGAIERRKARRKTQALSGCGGNEAGEFGDSRGLEGLQSPSEGIIVELGRGHTGRNQAGGGLMLEEPGDQGECLADKS